MDKQHKNYFGYSYLVILVAVCIFGVVKIFLPSRLFPESKITNSNITVDSLALLAMSETDLNTATDSIMFSNDSINNTEIIASTSTMEGYSNIINFYKKLNNLELNNKGRVRIAYFSDSMTDGDFIVQDIRRRFQDTFGGKGVGFVAITSLSAGSRYSVSHRFSKNWQTQSFLNTKNPKKDFGIDGQVEFANASEMCMVEYRANDIKNADLLYNPTLYFGNSTNEDAYVRIMADKDSIVNKNLHGDQRLNSLILSHSNPKKIKLEFYKSAQIPFYGVNFDNGEGVHVDNFSIRGNSGLPLSILNTALMNDFNETFHYDLIVLHYGANVLNYGSTNYSWYERKMVTTIAHIKECFPEAEILIVSTADKSTKSDGEMKTDKAVEPLVASQRYYSEITKSAFINLYKLMGGNGSMVKWVQDKPSRANKDYTHFNPTGSKEIGNLIFEEIEKGYHEYKNLNKTNQNVFLGQ